jgi:hypothetical protein
VCRDARALVSEKLGPRQRLRSASFGFLKPYKRENERNEADQEENGSPMAMKAAPLKLVTKYEIPASVKGRFDHLGLDMAGNRLFVVAEEGGQVLVFDLGTGKIVKTISVPHPHAVLVRNDLNRLYITDEEKGAVNIYDAKTYDQVKSVPLKVDTGSIGYDPATHYLYVDNGGDNAHEESTMLSVVDTTAGTKLADIKIDGDTLEAMALEKMGSRLFLNNPAKNEVEVMDHYQSLGQVPSGAGGKTGLLAPELSRLFVPIPGKALARSAVYSFSKLASGRQF